MGTPEKAQFSRRERQIMDIVYARGEATALEILDALPQPPSYSAVRGLLRILEQKGHLKHRREGVRNIYLPTRPRRRAGRLAIRRVLETFYRGDVRRAVAALLDVSDADLAPGEIERIAAMIEKARKERR